MWTWDRWSSVGIAAVSESGVHQIFDLGAAR